MQIHNLEHGLRKAMTLVFRSKGLSANAADTKAKQHLNAATALFQTKCRECARDRKFGSGSPEMAIGRAKREVMAWAHRLP